MQLEEKAYGQVVVLLASGRIDFASGEAFRLRLLDVIGRQQGAPLLVLDFSKVEYVSSIALRALMIAAKEIKARAGKLAVANLTPVVKEIFEISRFNLVVKLHDTTRDAIASMSPDALVAFDTSHA